VEDPAEQGGITLTVLWRGIDDQPILFANQFIVQHEQDELILTIGQFQPPILLGEPAEKVAQAQRLSYVPINVIGRFAFTRKRFGELAGFLQEHLRKYDDAHRDGD
jgi:hypothetical protein